MSTHTTSTIATLYRRDLNNLGSVVFVGDPTHAQSSSYSDSKPDRVRSRKPAGWLVPKSYSRTVIADSSAFGSSIQRVSSTTRTHFYGNFRPLIGSDSQSQAYPNGVFTPSLGDRALIKAMLSIKDDSINLGVTLAEAGKTANLIGDTATRLARAFNNLKRGRWGRAAEDLGVNPFPKRVSRRDLASQWLEYRYGWMPLLNDVDNAARALAERARRYPPVITGKGFVRELREQLSLMNEGTGYPNWRSRKYFELAFARLDFEPANAKLIRNKSLGLTNPALFAWELLPLSFVVDWFYPVGDFVSCFDYDLGLSFKSGSLSKKAECISTRSAAAQHIKPGDSFFLSENRVRMMSMQRSTYASAPFPPFPTPRNALNFKRMADGLALLYKAFK